mmetsp:Transcript_8147/g.24009  ORF Transcript_8147/g.24009 Transcript_8147/m.24009 type:complete len:215 (-) Transcript_8147:95-739(-)
MHRCPSSAARARVEGAPTWPPGSWSASHRSRPMCPPRAASTATKPQGAQASGLRAWIARSTSRWPHFAAARSTDGWVIWPSGLKATRVARAPRRAARAHRRMFMGVPCGRRGMNPGNDALTQRIRAGVRTAEPSGVRRVVPAGHRLTRAADKKARQARPKYSTSSSSSCNATAVSESSVRARNQHGNSADCGTQRLPSPSEPAGGLHCEGLARA